MRESRLWAWVDANKPSWLAVERIEVTHPPGLSDCFWTDRRTGISGWLELKQCEITDKEFKAGRIPKIRPEQPMFLRRQAENGVPCGLILRVIDHGFYVWRANKYHEWSNMMRSNEAIKHGIYAGAATLEDLMMFFLP